MSQKAIKADDLPTFDPARYLRDDKDIAAYLTQVIEEGDTGELAHALGVAARASTRSPRGDAVPPTDPASLT